MRGRSLALILFLSFPLILFSSPVESVHSWSPEKLPSPQSDQFGICGRKGKKSAVCDPDGLLSESDADTIDGIINFIAEGTHGFKLAKCGSRFEGYQFAVAIIERMTRPTFSFGSAEDQAKHFAKSLHDRWGVGDAQCENGLVFFIAVRDRTMHVSTGRGTKKALPDRTVTAILDSLKPAMRNERYGPAIIDGVNMLGRAVGGQKVFTGSGSSSFFDFMPFLFFPIFGLCSCCGAITSYSASRRARARYARCKSALERLERDRTLASEAKYEAKSCPICLEDFKPGETGEVVRNAESVAAATSNSGNAGAASEERQTLLAAVADGTDDENIDYGRKLVLPCGHPFHSKCITEWVSASTHANNQVCPVCRQPIDESTRKVQTEGDWDTFEEEHRFRLQRMHDTWPDYVTLNLMYDWERNRRRTGLVQAPTFVSADPALIEAARGAGQSGSSFSFGGGSSSGGGGGGSSW